MSRLLSSKPARTVLSIWAWFALGVTVFVMIPIVAVVRLVTAPFDPGAYQAGRMFRRIGVIHEKLNPLWTFTVSGTVPDDPRRPYVVVANHESFVDILLICHVPMEMKWMSKSEFFKIPFVGWGMLLAKDIKLVRGDKKASAQALLDSRDRLEDDVSVMIFPEGTRSKSGELGEFRDGAFRIAIQAGAPILPMAVLGTRDALIKHDWRFGHVHAEVRLLDPIPVDGLTKDDVADLRDRTRTVIAETLDAMRVERASAGRAS
ncbi:MAG: 1-acyl-sn-glycerol-3-phosphate acyltransferase [Ilumatobacter sp.]|nr:1-acyl-sn-glycerol-3-phosphate acyltransferase [Ilumatobacter sp.]